MKHWRKCTFSAHGEVEILDLKKKKSGKKEKYFNMNSFALQSVKILKKTVIIYCFKQLINFIHIDFGTEKNFKEKFT